MYCTKANIVEVLGKRTKQKNKTKQKTVTFDGISSDKQKNKKKQKTVTFDGISSDDEDKRTERGTRRRKERKLLRQQLKQERKFEIEKRKLEMAEIPRRQRELYAALAAGDPTIKQRLLRAYNQAKDVLSRPDGPSQPASPGSTTLSSPTYTAAELSVQKEKALDFLGRWNSVMNASKIKVEGATMEEQLDSFHMKYRDREFDGEGGIAGTTKAVALSSFCKDGWTKSFMGEFRRDGNLTSSGDESYQRVEPPSFREDVREAMAQAMSKGKKEEEKEEYSNHGRNAADFVLQMGFLTVPSEDSAEAQQNQPAPGVQVEQNLAGIVPAAENALVAPHQQQQPSVRLGDFQEEQRLRLAMQESPQQSTTLQMSQQKLSGLQGDGLNGKVKGSSTSMASLGTRTTTTVAEAGTTTTSVSLTKSADKEDEDQQEESFSEVVSQVGYGQDGGKADGHNGNTNFEVALQAQVVRNEEGGSGNDKEKQDQNINGQSSPKKQRNS